MINILLANIQPTDQHLNGHRSLSNLKVPHDFDMSVSNGDSLKIQVNRESYDINGNSYVQMKVDEIHKELCIDAGGYTVAIDKYSETQFQTGVSVTSPDQGCYQYDFSAVETDCSTQSYEYVVLSVPGMEPIGLPELHFRCDGPGAKGYCSDAITFEKETVLSVTNLFGSVKGIALKHCWKDALNPKANRLQYTMRFQRLLLPEAVLSKWI